MRLKRIVKWRGWAWLKSCAGAIASVAGALKAIVELLVLLAKLISR